MNDLEICKAIAEIEGIDVTVGYVNTTYSIIYTTNLKGENNEYNPLTDDALCFRLMEKYQVTPGYGKLVDSTGEHLWYSAWAKGTNWCPKVTTLNKATCLAIIAKHERENKQ